ncbi:hypothetical protein C7B67_10435 [filamentous cyanobacterium Phorm 6]|nr:hypothetical protein C7B67_10435 [filamentous cyanobacterium Phorm 6]
MIKPQSLRVFRNLVSPRNLVFFSFLDAEPVSVGCAVNTGARISRLAFIAPYKLNRCALRTLKFPIPNSQFPIPNSQFPIPNSQFPIINFNYEYQKHKYSMKL